MIFYLIIYCVVQIFYRLRKCRLLGLSLSGRDILKPPTWQYIFVVLITPVVFYFYMKAYAVSFIQLQDYYIFKYCSCYHKQNSSFIPNNVYCLKSFLSSMKIAMPFAPRLRSFPCSSLLWPLQTASMKALLPAALWLGLSRSCRMEKEVKYLLGLPSSI